MFKTLLATSLLTLALAAPAQAQLTGKPLFHVPGVVNYQSLGTVFSCTNTGTGPATATVEIYDNTGAFVASGTTGTLGIQQTAAIGTRTINSFALDTTLTPPVTASLSRGSAKIFSTSKSVMCQAFTAEVANNPPTSITNLVVVAGTKQK